MSNTNVWQNKKWVKDQMVSLYSLIASTIIILFVGKLLSFIQDNTDWDYMRSVLLENTLDNCLPERAETLTYYSLTILFPVFFVCFYLLFGKILKTNNYLVSKKVYSLTSPLTVTVIAMIFILVLTVSVTKSDVLFSRYGNGCEPWIYGVTSLIIIYPVYLGFKLNKSKVVKIAFWVFAILFVLFIFEKLRQDNMLLTDNYSATHHFYAWWYPVYKVFSGQTIMVDFESIYGFYPYIVVYALRFLGEVDQRTCSLFIAMCLSFLCLCLYEFCYIFIKNKILAFIVATGASVIGPARSLCNNEIYLQYFPTRVLFPIFVMAMIAVNYILKGKLKFIHKVLMCPVCALAIFWNIESGLVATVIWAGYLILMKALDYDLKNIKLWLSIFATVVSSGVSVAIAFGAIEIITHIKSGVYIGLSEITFGINAFMGTGFYMLPIEFGIWIMFVISYMIALIYPLRNLMFVRGKENSIENRTQLVGLFIAAITGIGSFSYFVGRSYPTNVLTILYPTVLIAGMLLEKYFADTKKLCFGSLESKMQEKDIFIPIFSNVAKQAVCLLLAGFVCVQVITLVGNNYNKEGPRWGYLVSEENCGNTTLEQQAGIINQWAEKKNNGITPELYIYFGSVIHEINLEKTTEKVCEQIDWFYKKNVHSYIDAINSNKKAFVIDEAAKWNLEYYYSNEWNETLKDYKLDEIKETGNMNGGTQNFYFYVLKK